MKQTHKYMQKIFKKSTVIPKCVFFFLNSSLLCFAQLKPIPFDEGAGYRPFTSKWRIAERWQEWGCGEGGFRKEDEQLRALLCCAHGDPHTSQYGTVWCCGGERKLVGRLRRMQHRPKLLEVGEGGRRFVPEKQALTHRCLCCLACARPSSTNLVRFADVWKAQTPRKKTSPPRKIWLEREPKKRGSGWWWWGAGDYCYSWRRAFVFPTYRTKTTRVRVVWPPPDSHRSPPRTMNPQRQLPVCSLLFSLYFFFCPLQPVFFETGTHHFFFFWDVFTQPPAYKKKQMRQM